MYLGWNIVCSSIICSKVKPHYISHLFTFREYFTNHFHDNSNAGVIYQNGRQDLAIYGGISTAWWRHQMETFSALLAFCAGNSPHKGQWPGALAFSLVYVWINGWVNNRVGGDLRSHGAHYDVTVMGKHIANSSVSHRQMRFSPKKCICCRAYIR